MGDLTHNIDSKLGQYGFYYDEQNGKYEFKLKYWTDPRFGQYIMYYDIISSGVVSYKLRYNIDPDFGKYTFIYNPLEKLHIEEEVLVKTKSNNIDSLTNEGVKVMREKSKATKSTIDSFISFIGRLDENIKTTNKSKIKKVENIGREQNISIDEFISLLFYEGIAQKELAVLDNEFFTSDDENILDSQVNSYESFVTRQPNTESALDSSEKGVVFENRALSDEVGSMFFVSTIDILAKIQSDEMLMNSIKRKIEIEQETRLNPQPLNIEIEEEIRLNSQAKKVDIEPEIIIDPHEREIQIEGSEKQLLSATKDLEVKYDNKDSLLKSIYSNKIEVEFGDKQKGMSKSTKQSLIENGVVKTGKSTNELSVFDEGITLDKTTKENKVNDDAIHMDNVAKKAELDDDSLHLDKIRKKITIDKDILLDKATKDTFVEVETRLDRSKEQKIQKEIEERLNLHKRFWFLESLGEMDYKILPNVDYKYPPNIEVFKTNIPNQKYVYKYVDKFKELGNYRVRLHKEDLTILGQHDVMYMQNYRADNSGIEISMKVREISDKKHNYEVEFEIYTDIEVDYMVINQPEGFIGNEFVFVATEKFLANNHPIPLGEDLGLREIPVSIAIMVDFMNILLLLWSKRLLAFSGMTGTQAIKGMAELVYEWLTLDTSLEAESIEDYFRCYRWFRWESEKVYNKAKLDPNLKGNRWIEEVIFEMIDYMDMHHFNKMPEWDMVLKMDEHRNIFIYPQYDIPIVLDKFKGVRKRVIEKNKRFN